jgi:hypothetical protein
MRGSCVALFLSLIACGGRREANSPMPPELMTATGAGSAAGPQAAAGDTFVVGRVLLDGQPVPYYGVTVARNFTSFYQPPTPIRAADGRFRVAVPKPDTWDVVIAGPGFARTVLPGKAIGDGQTLDLGDISVGHGHTIRGAVRDDSGAPVANARVALVASPWPGASDDLAELAHGNIAAITDARGNYRIAGTAAIALDTGRRQITASTADQRWSLPAMVPDTDATVDFMVGPTGALDATVVGSVQASVFATARSNRGGFLAGQKHDRVVHFDNLLQANTT